MERLRTSGTSRERRDACAPAALKFARGNEARAASAGVRDSGQPAFASGVAPGTAAACSSHAARCSGAQCGTPGTASVQTASLVCKCNELDAMSQACTAAATCVPVSNAASRHTAMRKNELRLMGMMVRLWGNSVLIHVNRANRDKRLRRSR